MFANPYGQAIATNGDNWGRNHLGMKEWLALPWSDKSPQTFIGKVSQGLEKRYWATTLFY